MTEHVYRTKQISTCGAAILFSVTVMAFQMPLKQAKVGVLKQEQCLEALGGVNIVHAAKMS